MQTTISRPAMTVSAELTLAAARIQLARFNHGDGGEYIFRPNAVFWLDACLTPRRPDERARFADRWGPHRYAHVGSVLALPPGETVQFLSAGGRRTSLICQLPAEAVYRWLPRDFELTDRRLESCLDIANANLRRLLVRLAEELHDRGPGYLALSEFVALQLAVEFARYLMAGSEEVETGGLAPWRLRVIETRLAKPGVPPTLSELAALCKVSVRHLTRSFRSSRGCSLGDYMAQSRIETAKRRLATDESIKAIAIGLGYSSHSTFTYAFRRVTGVTPRQFRTRVLRAGEGAAVSTKVRGVPEVRH